MPKAKPDSVVVHRIEFNTKERELLEAWVGGSVVKNALLPVAVVGGVGSAAYIGYKSAKATFKWTEDIIDDIKQEMQKLQSSPIGSAATTAGEWADKIHGMTPVGRALQGMRKVLFGRDN